MNLTILKSNLPGRFCGPIIYFGLHLRRREKLYDSHRILEMDSGGKTGKTGDRRCINWEEIKLRENDKIINSKPY